MERPPLAESMVARCPERGRAATRGLSQAERAGCPALAGRARSRGRADFLAGEIEPVPAGRPPDAKGAPVGEEPEDLDPHVGQMTTRTTGSGLTSGYRSGERGWRPAAV